MMNNPKKCSSCGCVRTKENSTRGGMPCARCNDCEIQRRAGKTARTLLKELSREQKKRKSTPQQIRRKEEEKVYQKTRNDILYTQIYKYGFMFCEICGLSTPNKEEMHTHHIWHRSQSSNAENLHSEINLIILCPTCHSALHRDKHMNDQLIKERGLEKIFK